METQVLVPWVIAALLYILGGYAFRIMVEAVDIERDNETLLPRALVTVMTVLWVFVMLSIVFRRKKTA